MKRFILIAALILCIPAMLSADFSFSLFNSVPLYKESLSDPYAFTSALKYSRALDTSLRPLYIRMLVKEVDDVSGNHTYKYLDLPYEKLGEDKFTNGKYRNFLYMKTGAIAPFFRFDFTGMDKLPDLSLELCLAAYQDTLFCLFSHSQMLGYDGSYFFGATARIADFAGIRFGLHHFSGHFADESIYRMMDYIRPDFANGGRFSDPEGAPGKTYYFLAFSEYVRDNSYLLSVSFDLPFGLRMYSSLEVPMNSSYIRPIIHTPGSYDPKKAENPSLVAELAYDEGWPKSSDPVATALIADEAALKASSSYRAYRADIGLEWNGTFNAVSLVASADLQLHQDGKTMHRLGAYSPDKPWEKELTCSLAVFFNDVKIAGKNLGLNVTYHDGRVPVNQFYYQRYKTVYLGFSIN